MARLEKLAAQAEEEEVYVLRLSDDAKECFTVATETRPPSSLPKVDEAEITVDEELVEKMEVDAPECGDIELLPDIPDMDFEDEKPFQPVVT